MRQQVLAIKFMRTFNGAKAQQIRRKIKSRTHVFDSRNFQCLCYYFVRSVFFKFYAQTLRWRWYEILRTCEHVEIPTIGITQFEVK